MSDGVSSAGRSGSPVPVSPASAQPSDGDAPAARRSLGHPELRSRGSAGGPPDREYTVFTAVALHALASRDLAVVSMASRACRQAVGHWLQLARSLVDQASGLAGSREPSVVAGRLLDEAARLPVAQRFLPLKALATQVPHLPAGVADQVAARIDAAASGLGPDEQAALRAALRGPDRGLHRGFAQTGFF